MLFNPNANYYITRGVADKIDAKYINCIIDIINLDRFKKIEPDYFKIFIFRNHPENEEIIQIEESQEQPEFKQTLEISGHLDEPFKLWVISDGGKKNENVTILFPEEY